MTIIKGDWHRCVALTSHRLGGRQCSNEGHSRSEWEPANEPTCSAWLCGIHFKTYQKMWPNIRAVERGASFGAQAGPIPDIDDG